MAARRRHLMLLARRLCENCKKPADYPRDALLKAYRDMLVAIVGKVDTAVKAGKSLDEVKAMKPADGFGVNPTGFITADRFIEMVYGTLKPE